MFHIHLTIADNKLRENKNLLVKKNGEKYSWAEILILGLNALIKKRKSK